ncbi:MAG TPA: Ig-like domain-containing protein [Candidatus Limnocylindria bacterium]|nr:Ig-like domain-containing protein [Candidatus Limnocylindria bacterium]
MRGVRPRWQIRGAWLAVLAAVLVAACTSAPTTTPTIGPGGRPGVAIDSPANGSPTPVGQPLIVQARAEDPNGSGVNRIDLRVGDILVDSESTVGLVPQASFSAALSWTPSADGVVTLSVTSYRPDGTASPPATITVAVTLSGQSPPPIAPSPTPTSVAVATPTPFVPTPVAGPTPTPAPRPTLPPFATPSPTPSPTPEPTPEPIAIDLAVTLADLPGSWVVGTEYTISAIVSNEGTVEAPPVGIRVRLCLPADPCEPAGGGNAESSPLEAGSGLDYAVSLTPTEAGERRLRVRLVLPPGYVDTNPANNEFFTAPFDVEPAPEPPPEP